MGMDISKEALKMARQKLGDDIPLFEHDITKIFDTEIEPPDYLICSETLEHIPDADKAVEGIFQLAKKETIVIITVPIEKYKNQIKSILTKLGLFNRLFPGIENALSEWHVQDFSKQDLHELVKDKFTVVHYETILLMHQLIVLVPKKAN
jgi:ubiquinone/menaquinone biosynthesis C-methylase UbiE